MIDTMQPGVGDADDLGRPSAAAYEQAGAQPLDAAEREKLQDRLDDLRRGPSPAEWVLPLAASVEARGKKALAAELRARAADPATTWVPGERLQVPGGDQVRALRLPGPASIWVDDHRVGPVTAGEDSGWSVVAGLADGEHVLLAVMEAGAAPVQAGRRSGVIVRLASTEQDLVMVPAPAARASDLGGAVKQAARVFVARFLVV